MKQKNGQLIGIFAASLLLFAVVSCKFAVGSTEYTSAEDNFSVTFPAGAGTIETGTEQRTYTGSGRSYSTSFDNRSDNYRSYEVQVYDQSSDPPPASFTERDILELGLNGWEDDPGTVIKDITVNGLKGIDSVRSIEIGPAKMTFREVVFWSPASKKLYLVQVAATNKDNVSTKEADDFVNSFKIR